MQHLLLRHAFPNRIPNPIMPRNPQQAVNHSLWIDTVNCFAKAWLSDRKFTGNGAVKNRGLIWPNSTLIILR